MITQNNEKIVQIKEYLNTIETTECIIHIEKLDQHYESLENETKNNYVTPINNLNSEMEMRLSQANTMHSSIIMNCKNAESQAKLLYKNSRDKKRAINNIGKGYDQKIESGINNTLNDLSKVAMGPSSFFGSNEEKHYAAAKKQRKQAEKARDNEISSIKKQYNSQIEQLEQQCKNEINQLQNSYENDFTSILQQNKQEIIDELNDFLSSMDHKENKYMEIFHIFAKINIALNHNLININDIQNKLQEVIVIDELKKISQDYTNIYESNKTLFNEIKSNDSSISSEIKEDLKNNSFYLKENKQYTEIDLSIDINDKEQLSKNKKDFSLLKKLAKNTNTVMSPIKTAIDKYNKIKASDTNDTLEANYNNAVKIIEAFGKVEDNALLDRYNEFYDSTQVNNDLKAIVKDKFYQGGIVKLNDFNQNIYFVKDLEEYPYLDHLDYLKTNISSFEEFVKNVDELNFDKFKQEISALKKKIWLKRLIIFVLIASLPLGFFTYKVIEQKKQEALIEQQRIEKQEKIRKEKERQEAIRIQNNIKRVESTIFVDSILKKEEKSLLSKINKENISESNKKQYLDKYTKLTKDTFKNIDVKSICAKEANKETVAIAKCTQNNQKVIDDFSKKTLKKVPSLINNRIFSIKFDKKKAKLNSIIKDLEKKNKSAQDKASKLKQKMDGYLIDGKKTPKKLQSEVDKLNSQSKNYTYQIKEYKKQLTNKKITIIEPTMTKQKTPVKKETTKENKNLLETVTQPKKETKTISKETRIKQLQELIDDAYINGTKPDPKLVEELNKLKGTN